MVSKHFLPAYSRMLQLKKKEYVMVIWPTLQINRRETTDNAHSDRCSFKICEKLTHCAGEKDICWKMWLFLKRTHLVHPWKILVHPGVYDTPGWQALLYVTVFGNFHTISKLGWEWCRTLKPGLQIWRSNVWLQLWPFENFPHRHPNKTCEWGGLSSNRFCPLIPWYAGSYETIFRILTTSENHFL